MTDLLAFAGALIGSGVGVVLGVSMGIGIAQAKARQLLADPAKLMGHLAKF